MVDIYQNNNEYYLRSIMYATIYLVTLDLLDLLEYSCLVLDNKAI